MSQFYTPKYTICLFLTCSSKYKLIKRHILAVTRYIWMSGELLKESICCGSRIKNDKSPGQRQITVITERVGKQKKRRRVPTMQLLNWPPIWYIRYLNRWTYICWIFQFFISFVSLNALPVFVNYFLYVRLSVHIYSVIEVQMNNKTIQIFQKKNTKLHQLYAYLYSIFVRAAYIIFFIKATLQTVYTFLNESILNLYSVVVWECARESKIVSPSEYLFAQTHTHTQTPKVNWATHVWTQ